MAGQRYTNNSSSTLASSVASGATTITLATGGGALFASPSGGDWQMLTITNAVGTTIEIVKMTGRAGDVLTVARAQEGTTAVAWAAGDAASARLTAGMLSRLLENTADGDGLALGPFASANATASVAAGSSAAAAGGRSVAVGNWAQARMSGSVAIGQSAQACRPNQLAMTAHACFPRDDWWAGSGSHYNAGAESAFASAYCELGTPSAWTASTSYTDGATVAPTTPNGKQYTLWHGAYNPSALPNTMVSGATQPAWPTAVGDDVAADAGGTHRWLCWDVATGLDEVIPAGMTFYPTEVGFICFNYSGVTAAPFVSIGTAASPSMLVSNQQLTSITGAGQRHVFTGFKHGITDLRCKLVTAATGASARFHGRFYAKGIFIQTQG